MLGSIGWLEILLLIAVLLLLFGAKRLPEVGRNAGLGISNFVRALRGGIIRETAPRPSTDDNHHLPASSSSLSEHHLPDSIAAHNDTR